MVIGIIRYGCVQHRNMALGFLSQAQTPSIVRRIERFFKEQTIKMDLVARAIMQIIGNPCTVNLALDRTNWMFGKSPINFLILAIVTSNNAAIPIFFSVLNKNGSSNTDERTDLLDQFISLFGASRIHSLTADREFIGDKWFKFLLDKKIPFFIRVKKNWLVDFSTTAQVHISTFFKHLCYKQERLLYKDIFGHGIAIAGTRSADGELVMIVTNQVRLSAKSILNTYKARWCIETIFRHVKKCGFNLENTHMVNEGRLSTLMTLISVAVVLCVITGDKEANQTKIPYRRTVGAYLYSIFRVGFDFLRRLWNDLQKVKQLLSFEHQIIARC